MILSARKDPTLEALVSLTHHDYAFYLDGSRYHGDAKKESDFDFFVGDTEAVNKYLLAEGYEAYDSDWYRDSNSVNIYHKGNVQIITVKDVDARLVVQEYMRGKARAKDVDFWSNLYDKYYRGELNES